jgi:hypothetical protein
MELQSAVALMHSSLFPSTVKESTVTEHWTRDLLLRSGDSITHPCLVELRRRGLRTGNWRHLDSGQKALFQCALWIAKLRGKITNTKLMVEVREIAQLLGESFRNAVLRAGRKRIMMMREGYAKPAGVFSWAPQISRWLNDSGYVRYLGVLEVNP